MTKAEKESKKLNNRIEELESALKVIHTWATFDNGHFLDPKNVADLCERTLEKR